MAASSRWRLARLGLRARITLAFALGALLLSLVLAGTTYAIVRESLVRQRERTALDRTYVNARLLRDALRTSDPDVPRLLDSLQISAGSRPVLELDDRWYASTLEYGRDALPEALRERVTDGSPARMRYELDGEPVLAVGVPIPAAGAAYYEIVSLAEVESTLRAIGVSLLGAAAVTTLAGAALGAWAARAALRPLRDAAKASEAIAGGALDTRLDPVDDPDLRGLVSSFNEMAQALQSRIERDSRFASDVSHELRSPLMTLSASIEVLQSRRDEMPERAATALDLLVADVARFQNLVEDLLEISRFDAGAVRLDLEEVRLVDLVLHAAGMGGDPEVPVDVEPAAADAIVLADKRRLVRVLANLLDNARMHGAGVERVSVRVVEDRVQIAVDDAGPGVAIDERQLIFERFARGGGAGRRGSGEGVGLGLALVREHVRLLGGQVWVDDRPDGRPGAHFVVELPLAVRTIEMVG
ncbi:MAG: HAMP domain-containing histidine kinase [Acidimicrobiales bacterium]|nr:HAMP domain-containing histidine kinase [Acidimicrobiales bacterium]